MILQRLTTALRKQDWFTVLIETLIVVLGVFLGLQVNNWNADRVARAEADDLLWRLVVEAEAARADLAVYRDLHDEILDRSIKLPVRLKATEDCLAMDEEMKRLVLAVGDFSPPRFSLATAREAIDSGKISDIRSDQMRDEVRRIIDEMSFIDRQWERYVRVKQDSEKMIYTAAGLSFLRVEALKVRPGVQWDGIDQYDIQTPEAICGNPEIIASASNAAMTQHVYSMYLSEASEKLDRYAVALSNHRTGASMQKKVEAR